MSQKSTQGAWRPSVRMVVSLLLILHLGAVFLGPFAFATQAGPGGESPFASLLMGVFRPYIDLAYLNHGYFFFAPNPGASFIVRYRIDYEDGRPAITGQFPDLKKQFPRLLYHRHFMLSEQWNAEFVPAQLPPQLTNDPERARGWERQRHAYELQKRSFEQHLAAKFGGRVTLTRVEHRPGELFEVLQDGKSLNAPESYRELSENGPGTQIHE